MFAVALALLLLVALPETHGASQNITYTSRADINPVALILTQNANSSSYTEGLYFTCPRGDDAPNNGPAIYRSDGTFVWDGKAIGDCFDLRTQTLNGTEVLTVWHGDVQTAGWGSGRALILNSTYDVIYNLTTSIASGADIHEFTIPQVNNKTALLSAYYPVQTDFSCCGGNGSDWMLEAYFEEVDIASGSVLFAWNASTHVSFNDSYSTGWAGTTFDNSWDFFHINSIDKDTDGNYLVSSRHYHALYYIDGTDGHVLWTLGGKNSSFTLGDGVQFEWQHDARWVDPSTRTELTLFDNASNGVENDESSARGLYLEVDYAAQSVSLRAEYFPLTRLVSDSQGSTTLLPDGNVLLGWGSNPWITEHTQNGTLIYAAALGGQDLTNGPLQNYRAFKSTTWKGYPRTWPDVNFNGTDVYASWNGTTEVASWEALAGSSGTALTSALNASSAGFETKLSIGAGFGAAQVRAYDGDGNLLGASAVLSSAGEVVGDGSALGVPVPSTSSTSSTTSKKKSGAGPRSVPTLVMFMAAAATAVLSVLV